MDASISFTKLSINGIDIFVDGYLQTIDISKHYCKETSYLDLIL